jgi:Domain of unknown function (DUF222)
MFDTEMLSSGLEQLDPEWVDDEGLPADLESIPPGLLLAVILSSVDREGLSGFDRVSLVKARSRMISHLQAELYADIQAVSGSVSDVSNRDEPDPQDVFYTTASEIQAALTLTRRAGEMQTDLAFRLFERLPQCLVRHHDGVIDLSRARVLCDQTCHLPRDLAQQVCDTALERASGLTTGQLRAHLQRLIITVDPASARDRYEQKLKDRRIVSEMTDAGIANPLGLDLPPADTGAAMRRINRLARTAKEE